MRGTLSRLYGWMSQARAEAYRRGWIQSVRLPRPVISVGNLSLGGTGKTPLTAYLARLLLQEGLTPAILSRGYRSQGEKSNLLVSDGRELLASVRMAGDEAWMLA
ncbi:MAG TPA: tetraacyldisaccharide 4'-kinase, partial [Acidobacteriota bacterium]|nr:tetraacyldisaccharide 4'-kinase [Acidobacteriota bacterium]